MLKIKIIVFISLSLFSQFILAKEKTYIRDYNYQASDTDSKVSARNASLLFLKQNLLSEIGTYVGSTLNIVSIASGAEGVTVSAGQIKSLTEGYIKTEILEQKWNGVTFYIKAKMKADPEEIAAKLKSIAEASNVNKSKSSEEFEYWKSVVQIDSNEAYLNYIKKYPEGKYLDLAQISISRLLKEKKQEDTNNSWLVKSKSNGNITIVARHDTGPYSDIDNDVVTKEMALATKKILRRYLPSSAKFALSTNFEFTEKFLFNYKEFSGVVCNRTKTDLLVGAMLEDHEGSGGMWRPIRLFIRDCNTQAYKYTSFVPKGSSSETFWRKNDLQKNLRVFIQDYLDTI